MAFFAQPAFALSSGWCVPLTRDLSVGKTGADVEQLQTFLSTQQYTSAGTNIMTGYYGPLTQQAVREFQSANGLPATGSVDSATRALLSDCPISYFPGVSNYPFPFPNPSPYPVSYPVSSTSSTQYPASYAYPAPQYQVAYQFPSSSQTLITSTGVTNISGPVTLVSGRQGRWDVTVATPNPSGTTLTVSWSDNNMYDWPTVETDTLSGPGMYSFFHTYTGTGVYTVTFTVKDSYGTASKATTVTVIQPTYQSSRMYY
ncbi:MAG: peptidoglycan-binding protein [Patescibacteria group bacterium]|nr:peptidoglycan-binding protein [Patescibacteria group bacterium]